MLRLLFFLCCLYPALSYCQKTGSQIRYADFFPDSSCSVKAFSSAVKGYQVLDRTGLLHNRQYLSIVDFTRSSRQPRFFVLDMQQRRLVYASTTAHGLGSDPDSTTYAQCFSNIDGSRASSVGFYITGSTYNNHRPFDSLGLCLFGMDKGFNDAAAQREIVIHCGASERTRELYVTDTGAGRSFGCPALPLSTNTAIIERIKGGSCLFIYSDKVVDYARRSTVLNNQIPKRIRQQGPPPNSCSCNLRRKS